MSYMKVLHADKETVFGGTPCPCGASGLSFIMRTFEFYPMCTGCRKLES